MRNVWEAPMGAINGTNTSFTSVYSLDSNVFLVYNGIVYPSTDDVFGFTVVPPYEIQTNFAPQTDETLLVMYLNNALI